MVDKISGNNSTICVASIILPTPISPQACSPCAGYKIWTPSNCNCLIFLWLAGLCHISTFMAGATTSGMFRAAAISVMMLSAMPWAILASVLAVAGAISMMSAERVALMCAIPLPLPPCAVSMGLPLRA